MIQPLLVVYSMFSVCIYLMCSAGKPVPLSTADEKASKLNNKLKAGSKWDLLVTLSLAEKRNLKDNNGQELDVSDLLARGPDDNIVTLENYTDKLLKSSVIVNCAYGESAKSIIDGFINVIARLCKKVGLGNPMLDCMERFWRTIDISKLVFGKMLKVLRFFFEANQTACPEQVIVVLDNLLEHYDRQKYNKFNYLESDGTVMVDNLKSDYDYFVDRMQCASKLLRNFINDRCLRVRMEEIDKSGEIDAALGYLPTQQTISLIFNEYNHCLLMSYQTYLTGLGDWCDEE